MSTHSLYLNTIYYRSSVAKLLIIKSPVSQSWICCFCFLSLVAKVGVQTKKTLLKILTWMIKFIFDNYFLSFLFKNYSQKIFSLYFHIIKGMNYLIFMSLRLPYMFMIEFTPVMSLRVVHLYILFIIFF